MAKKNSLPFEVPSSDSSLREGTAISNLDGRLWGEVGANTGRFFGDEALVRTRVGVEARYLIALSKIGVIRSLSSKEQEILLSLHEKITPSVYKSLRKIETQIRHDVIAMTQIMKKLLGKTKSLDDVLNHGWVHWGLASEDIDNLSKAVLTTSYLKKVFLPQVALTLKEILVLTEKTKKVVIPGKTHLQTAIPTLLGKEVGLFGIRLAEAAVALKNLKLRAKLTGAVGNLAAHKSVYPKINWRTFSKKFVESLGLEANPYTTQIEPRNNLYELLSKLELINLILIDLSQDMRIYIGFDWLSQEARKVEFGSSAMPQKVNPIDFENSQGNALFSNWIVEGLKRQLPVSWLQRDLVDKTILRNFGLPFGYSLISLVSTAKGLTRLTPNLEKIESDINSDLGLLAEAYQINLRAMGQGEAYNDLKNLARGKRLVKEDIDQWLAKLKVDEKTRSRLSKIAPETYTGYAKENTEEIMRKIKRIISNLL